MLNELDGRAISDTSIEGLVGRLASRRVRLKGGLERERVNISNESVFVPLSRDNTNILLSK